MVQLTLIVVRMTGAFATRKENAKTVFSSIVIPACIFCTVRLRKFLQIQYSAYGSRISLRVIRANKKESWVQLSFLLVRMTGLEPAQPCDYKNLNLTRLPVPPHPQVSRYILSHLQRFATDIDVFCKKIFTFVRFYLA